MDYNNTINEFINYALDHRLIKKYDTLYIGNRLIDLLNIDSYTYHYSKSKKTIDEILDDLLEIAISKEIIKDSVLEKDLFDTKIMNLVTPMPREVEAKFKEYYQKDSMNAVSYLYNLSVDTNYVRINRSLNDLEWTSPSKYGELKLSINLAKPEYDPKEYAFYKRIERAKINYPKCMLCRENCGFSGSLVGHPNTNLRYASIKLNNEKFFIYFSPYSYYKEHCHIVSYEHIPMEINDLTLVRLTEFVDKFPQYFIGSNADLPIIGSSVLSHEHYKGGIFDFPIANALPILRKTIDGVDFEYLKWPLTTFKLTTPDKDSIIKLGNKIIHKWREYSCNEIHIVGEGSVKHNSVTLVLRKVDKNYILYVTLRNNHFDEKHLYGYFHPDERLHHIKKENIGIVEVMGMAILPGRLHKELEVLRKVLNGVYDESYLEQIKVHKDWYQSLKGRYYTEADIHNEVSKKFEKILESCNVFKYASRDFVIDFIESIED